METSEECFEKKCSIFVLLSSSLDGTECYINGFFQSRQDAEECFSRHGNPNSLDHIVVGEVVGMWRTGGVLGSGVRLVIPLNGKGSLRARNGKPYTMSETKIKVPDGMLAAAYKAAGADDPDMVPESCVLVSVEAALCWLDDELSRMVLKFGNYVFDSRNVVVGTTVPRK